MVAVEMEKVKHSSPVSSTLSDVMEIGTHCMVALALIWKLLFRAVKSSGAEEKKRAEKTQG